LTGDWTLLRVPDSPACSTVYRIVNLNFFALCDKEEDSCACASQYQSAQMSGFDSEAAAYIVGIIVGAVAAIVILALLGWYLYRRLGIANIDDDEELQSLRREASRYEEPQQADRNEALRPSTSNVIRPEDDDGEEMEEGGTGEKKSKLLKSAAVAATMASKASSNRKQAWRM
jgi:hypothetical protein